MPSDARSGYLAQLEDQLLAERARCAALQDALDQKDAHIDELNAEVASLTRPKGKAKGKNKEE